MQGYAESLKGQRLFRKGKGWNSLVPFRGARILVPFRGVTGPLKGTKIRAPLKGTRHISSVYPSWRAFDLSNSRHTLAKDATPFRLLLLFETILVKKIYPTLLASDWPHC